jgi:tRNA (guanosine-2'-O-)-methyltransferase
MQRTDRRLQKIKTVLEKRQSDITVVLENIHDPHNVSAVFRTCDAVGVLRVELVYTVERFPRIGKKSSSSANKWVMMRHHRSLEECYATLRQEGFAVLATRVGTGSVPLFGVDLTKKVALVFGNEHRGVSDRAAQLADSTFEIPMRGMIQSLNVSVACAVNQQGGNKPGDIPYIVWLRTVIHILYYGAQNAGSSSG